LTQINGKRRDSFHIDSPVRHPGQQRKYARILPVSGKAKHPVSGTVEPWPALAPG
jgi:hypothetical protein